MSLVVGVKGEEGICGVVVRGGGEMSEAAASGESGVVTRIGRWGDLNFSIDPLVGQEAFERWGPVEIVTEQA